MRRWSQVLVYAAIASVAAPAWAQFGGSGGGGAPGGGAPSAGEEKPEGPAEAAPEEKGESPALQPLPAWPQQREKQLQFFQLNGYIRFRAFLFHNLNLGYYDKSTGPRAPFPIPISEFNKTGMAGSAGSGTDSSCAARNHSNCRDNDLTSADMRLRLEPTLNVTEQVRVKAQIDVFDNMVLGTTPQSYYLNNRGFTSNVPIPAESASQQAPQPGLNSVYDSIRAKRAWAEVRTPFGELRFGRMPSHWGMGMLVNNGDCLDCDFGDNADRVMFATKLWGHFIAFLWDWVATGPTTQIIGPQSDAGRFYNAEPLDDTSQWILALGKMDKPEELKEKLDAGKAVFNYGGYFVYRQQTWAETNNPMSPTNNSVASLQADLVPRNARAFIPDLWLRLNWKKLHIEAEGAMVVGSIGNISDIYAPVKGSVDILSGGFTVKADYKLLHDALKIYFEMGFASGDDSEDPNAAVNFQQATLVPVNNHIGRFAFSPDYHVDLILFREILGTVNNATYFKPGVSYDIVDNFGARVDILYALANKPVAYPGNAYNLGLEIDAALMYKNEEEGFYAGLVYGVLFPFDALNFPATIFGPSFAHNTDTAQTFQARLYVKF
ncbi:MAG: TIGR04551 family protein [Polyangia bacterium]